MTVIGNGLKYRLLAWGYQNIHLYLPSTPRPGMMLPILLLLTDMLLSGCSSMISKVTGGVAEDLTAAILNQNDPETVRDGVPAYLLMLDGLVAGSPNDTALLSAAAELYAAYGVIFVDDSERARRLTLRAWEYGQRSVCSANASTCGMAGLHLRDLQVVLETLSRRDGKTLYSFGLSWLAYIQAHADEPGALARLPQATAVMARTRELDPGYRAGQVEMYLAVLHTIRPPALGGDFTAGRAHFKRAIDLTGGKDLSVQVNFARYYARALYDRELHDRILKQVLAADPVAPDLTLTNTIAQRQAFILLAAADEYF